MSGTLRRGGTGVGIALVCLVVWAVASKVMRPSAEKKEDRDQPAPVEVVGIERGPIRLERVFIGTIEPRSEYLVSLEVSGRVVDVAVDLGDTVQEGQMVARLDDAEYQQELAQAQADLKVAEANLAAARNELEVTRRAFERSEGLFARKLLSEAMFDTAQAELLAAEARVEGAEASRLRAQATVEAARIRLAFTKVKADWQGDGERVVAARFVDEGQALSANEPVIRLVEIQPLTGVIYVTEKDYGQLREGQAVEVRTDAYPRELFEGIVRRIAPVFDEASRQARVELELPNRDKRLKPGMFIRADILLQEVPDAAIVPLNALTIRQEQQGVFVVGTDGASARWVPVRVGIQEGDRIEVEGEGLQGRVITLGQHLVKDGGRILVIEPQAESSEGAAPRGPVAGPIGSGRG